MGGIKGAIYRGEWQTHGINNWNDLLLYAFRELLSDLKINIEVKAVLKM